MKPDVSIIIPTYNRSEFVQDALLSAARQSYQNCEILIIDDGSDSQCLSEIEAILNHAEIKGRARLVRQNHQGVCAARNLGVKEAVGNFIQFLDSDDLLHPKKIEIQKTILNADTTLAMCYSLDEYFLKTPGDLKTLWNVPSAEFHLDRFLWGDPVWCTGSPLWRREAFESIGGWPENLQIGFYDDWVLHIRAIVNKLNYVYVPLVLHYVRDHSLTRLSLSGKLVDLEKSKSQAAELVFANLKNRELTFSRKDALAALLLFSADTLLTAGFKQEGKKALEQASKYAGTAEIKFLSFMMKRISVSRLLYKMFSYPFRRLLRKRMFEKRGYWKLQKPAAINEPAESNIKLVLTDLTEKNSPRISVIICAHNGAAKLRSTLQSRLDQSLSNEFYEIVIVDNASTDDTRDYIKSLNEERQYPINYVYETQLGLHFARHAGARAAKGDLLVFTDDDASADPELLSCYIKAFERHPSMKAAGGPVLPQWESPPEDWLKEIIGKDYFFPALALLDLYKEFRLSPDGLFFGVNLAVKRNVLFSLGGFNPDSFGAMWLGDGESGLLRRLLEKGMHVGYVPDAKVYHHIPPERMTRKYLKRWSQNWGATEAYAKYSEGLPSTARLFVDLFSLMILRMPKISYIALKHRGKNDPLSIHRIMWAHCALEQMRYVWRLISSQQFRKFVTHKDWLNHPPTESLSGIDLAITASESK
jgi:glycosyltransferase involved in cell wall biosynthesis